MPGMMETVLNVGLNDESVHGLAAMTGGDERFAWDSYRRLLQMFGATVLGIEAAVFHEALDGLKEDRGRQRTTSTSTADDLPGLVATYQRLIEEHAGRPFPQDPREQLDLAVRAVFDSWNTERAVLYRRQERIPERPRHCGEHRTMVFGNRGDDSGTGVAFTRDPATGSAGRSTATTWRTPRARTSSRASATPCRSPTSRRIDKASYDELLGIMATLENHYRDMCDIEFTIERGKLWMLQTRVGKRTPEAAFRIALHMVDEGLIDKDEALQRVTGAQLAQLMFPRFDDGRRPRAARDGHGRLARRGGRQGGLRLGDRGRVGRARRGRDPGPQGDQPRRPARDGRGPGHPDQPRRQDLARRGGGPRHGPHLRVRRRGARRRRRARRSSPSGTASPSARAT